MNNLDIPLAELQQQVREAWLAVLNVGSLGLHDNFFELGGQSLQALRVSAELKRRLGVNVPAICVFQTATVAALAQYIAGAASDAEFEYGSI